MPGIAKGQPQIVHLHGGLIGDRLEQLKRGKCIRLCVERCNRGLAAPRILTIEEFCVALLDVRRVRQHDANEVAGRARRIDLAAKSLAHETWDAAAVVDMRVRQKNRLNLSGIEREILVVHLTQTTRSLIHAAVHEISVIPHMEQVA